MTSNNPTTIADATNRALSMMDNFPGMVVVEMTVEIGATLLPVFVSKSGTAYDTRAGAIADAQRAGFIGA